MKFFLMILVVSIMPGFAFGDNLIFSLNSDLSPLNLYQQNDQNPYSEADHKAIEIHITPSEIRDLLGIEFELPDGFTVSAFRKKIVPSILGGFIWYGKVERDPNSYVSLNINDGKIIGELYAGGKVYRVQRDRNNQSYIAYLKPKDGMVLENLDDLAKFSTKDLGTRAAVTEKSTDKFIDVLLVFSTDAAGNANIAATIEANMVTVNQTLEDSCVDFRYRVVGIQATTYTSAGDISADLSAMNGFANIANARNTLGADLVQMFINANAQFCGLGNKPGSTIANPGVVNFNDDFGHSVVVFGCPAYTMSHEMGHNLSLNHDRYQQDVDITQPTSDTAGYGFVDTANKIRSIMSYSDHCRENGLSCPRIGKFSNPDLSHSGFAFGVEGFVDAARILNDNFGFVANYRPAATAHTGSFISSCGGAAQGQDVHCFIATATYGSYLHPKISILRTFRDRILKKSIFGKLFIKTYYKYSPPFARYIKNSPNLKKVSFVYIEILVFLMTYFWMLPLLFLGYFYRQRFYKLISFGLLFLFCQNSEATYSIPQYFEDIAPQNPSLLLDNSPNLTLAAQYSILSLTASPTLTKVEETDSFPQVYLAYATSSYALALKYQAESDKKTKTTTTPFTGSTVNEKTSDIELNLSTNYFFGLPLGLKYNYISSQIVNTEERTLNTINIGSDLGFGQMFKFGGGIIYNIESGKSLLTNTDLPPTNFLSIYASLGLMLNQAGEFSSGTGGGKTGFQMEVSYKRDPQVIETDGVSNNIHPETSTIAGYMQYGFLLGSGNNFLTSLQYQSRQESSVPFFIADSLATNQIDFSIGQSLGSFFLALHGSYITQDGTIGLSGYQALISIGYSSGVSAGAGGGASYY